MRFRAFEEVSRPKKTPTAMPWCVVLMSSLFILLMVCKADRQRLDLVQVSVKRLQTRRDDFERE